MLSGDCNICINGKMPSYSATCVECGLLRKNYKPITNADRIRSMSDEELAEFIVRCVEADFFRVNVLGTHSNSAEEWLDWLKDAKDG